MMTTITILMNTMNMVIPNNLNLIGTLGNLGCYKLWKKLYRKTTYGILVEVTKTSQKKKPKSNNSLGDKYFAYLGSNNFQEPIWKTSTS